MKFILGTKKYMTEVYSDDGAVHSVTVIEAKPITVTQVKTKTTDGYSAVQVGFGEKKEKKMTKPMKGHAKDAGNIAATREFRLSEAELSAFAKGAKIDLSNFKVGELVTIRAISKGKGFQGAVKRHGFGGGRRTHGQKHSEREVGTISGGGRAGGRVAKGIRMAGRMGGTTISLRNLKIVEVNPSENELVLEGAIPGVRGALVEIVSK